MDTIDLRQKLHHYIETAEDKKVRAIFTMVEDEIEETHSHWEDESFVAELRRREKAYIEGESTAYGLEQTIGRAKRALKKKR